MDITIFVSNQNHPITPFISYWINMNENYNCSLINNLSDMPVNGDILFLVSCNEKIPKNIRDRFRYTLVLHASDLPRGRGWSPHVWEILDGKNNIVLSLLSAEEQVDCGDIWKKISINIDKYELYDEINNKLFYAEIELIDWACKNIEDIKPKKQVGSATYYNKRSPMDSEIDINKSILEQFNKIRVSDPHRYPCFFYMGDKKFKLTIERYEESFNE